MRMPWSSLAGGGLAGGCLPNVEAAEALYSIADYELLKHEQLGELLAEIDLKFPLSTRDIKEVWASPGSVIETQAARIECRNCGGPTAPNDCEWCGGVPS